MSDDWGEETHDYPETLDVTDTADHYYVKCLACQKPIHDSEDAPDADCAARRHAGTHGGLYGEEAEIVITDHCGREIRRIHALYKAEQYEEGGLWECPQCGERHTWSESVSCPNCGRIPERARLSPLESDEGGSA